MFQDFDLCVTCFEKDGHPHKMEKLGLDIDDGSSPADQKQANPQVSILVYMIMVIYISFFNYKYNFKTSIYI